MSTGLQRGEAWYRSRFEAGHDDLLLYHGRRLPELKDEPWLPLDVLRNVADPEADVWEQALAGIAAEAMRNALNRLPGRERTVLLLIYEDDLTLEEVARRIPYRGWVMTRERVRQIKNEALKRLRGMDMIAGWPEPSSTRSARSSASGSPCSRSSAPGESVDGPGRVLG